MHMDGT